MKTKRIVEKFIRKSPKFERNQTIIFNLNTLHQKRKNVKNLIENQSNLKRFLLNLKAIKINQMKQSQDLQDKPSKKTKLNEVDKGLLHLIITSEKKEKQDHQIFFVEAIDLKNQQKYIINFHNQKYSRIYFHEGMRIDVKCDNINNNVISFDTQKPLDRFYYFVLAPFVKIAIKQHLLKYYFCGRKKQLSNYFRNNYVKNPQEENNQNNGKIIGGMFQFLMEYPQQNLQIFNRLPIQYQNIQKNIVLNCEEFTEFLHRFDEYRQQFNDLQNIVVTQEHINQLAQEIINAIWWAKIYARNVLIDGKVKITRFLEKEDEIEPHFGFGKARVDIVVEIETLEGHKYSMPIETKIGKCSQNDKAQLMAYMLLLSQQKQENIPFGLLLNLSQGISFQVMKYDLDVILDRNIYVSSEIKTQKLKQNYQHEDQPNFVPRDFSTLGEQENFQKCESCYLKIVCYGNLINNNIQYQQIKKELESKDIRSFLNETLASLRKEENSYYLQFYTESQDQKEKIYVLKLKNKVEKAHGEKIIQLIYEQIKITGKKNQEKLMFFTNYSDRELAFYFKQISYNQQEQQISLIVKPHSYQDSLEDLTLPFEHYDQFCYLRKSIYELCVNQELSLRKQQIVFGRKIKQEGNIPINLQTYQGLSNNQMNLLKYCIETESFQLIELNDGISILPYLLNELSIRKKKVFVTSFVNDLQSIRTKFETLFPQQIIGEIDKNTNSLDDMIYFLDCESSYSLIKDEFKPDYCIVYRASEIIEPLCIHYILRSKIFILMGNPEQRPKLLSEKNERLQISLFERLWKLQNAQ